MLATLLLFSLTGEASPTPAEQAAIFTAAGFTRRGAAWKSGNCDGAESESYSPGSLETYRDLNGDGHSDAVVAEGGAVCYGMAGTHFWLLSKQTDGRWRLLLEKTGMPEFLKATGAGGWPDILIGGPGFCFPVFRWNGKAYTNHRLEYDGKPCRP